MSDSPEPTAREVIDRLLASGISPTSLAVAVGVPVDTLLERGISRARSDSSDEVLATLGSVLMRRAVEEALYLLDQGTPQVKTTIIGRVMPALVALMTEDEAAASVEKMRGELDALKDDLRGPATADATAEGAHEGPDS